MIRQRGDTIIEVILAVSIFSLVAVGAMTIMNSGLAMVQRSLEITLVRQQIDSQAEMLRFVHDRARADSTGSYKTLWDNIVLVTNPTQLLSVSECPASISNSIALMESGSEIKKVSSYVGRPATYAKVEGTESQGISIQLVKVNDGAAYAYDAYIQACWDSPGSSKPVTMGTIVRIYDPAA